MVEQNLLPQINALLDSRLTALETRLTQQMDEKVQASIAALKMRMDAFEERMQQAFARQTEEVTNTMAEAVETASEIARKHMDGLVGEVLRQMRVLSENTEGKSIRILAEEVLVRTERINDHKTRITALEQ